MEREDAFDDDVGAGMEGGEGIGNAAVGAEVVDGALDGVALSEGAEVGDEELGLERVGVVEVALVAGVEREPARRVPSGGAPRDGDQQCRRGLVCRPGRRRRYCARELRQCA